MKRKVVKATIRPIVVKADGTITTDYTAEERQFFQQWQATTTAKEKDKVESHRVRKLVRAALKQCWFNARKVVLKLDEYAEASYVEGWVVSPGGRNHGARLGRWGRQGYRHDLTGRRLRVFWWP